jgi:hypothetical protein
MPLIRLAALHSDGGSEFVSESRAHSSAPLGRANTEAVSTLGAMATG